MTVEFVIRTSQVVPVAALAERNRKEAAVPDASATLADGIFQFTQKTRIPVHKGSVS